MSTHDEILATWLEEHGDLEMVLFKHKLSPAQLRAFVADPLVIATMDAHESLLARRRRILASMHMQNAAEMLSKSMFESSSLIECRRAATSLARLTRDMTRNSSPAPGGGGGRVREAGGGAFDPKETTAQAVAPHTTTPAPITHKTRDLPSHAPRETTARAVAPPSPPAAPITARDGRTPNQPLHKPHQPTPSSLPTTQNLTPHPRRTPASSSTPSADPTLQSAHHGWS